MSRLLEVKALDVVYPGGAGQPPVRAVRGIDLVLDRGETLALVGESGCGKSSIARALLRLGPPLAGTVHLRPEATTDLPLHRLEGPALQSARRHVQMVFQDPLASLNPRHTLGQAVEEALRALGPAATRRGASRRRRARELLEETGLDAALADRYPHEVSGGQRQRVGIARALAPDPALLVCDEAVSALDASLRAQILNLLLRLQRERGLAMLFITHDLAVVPSLADRVAVMYAGEIVETGPAREVLATPAHPYTQGLLAAVPRPDPGAARPERALEGEPPSPFEIPPGCAFASRCPLVEPECRVERPEARAVGATAGHLAACWLVE